VVEDRSRDLHGLEEQEAVDDWGALRLWAANSRPGKPGRLDKVALFCWDIFFFPGVDGDTLGAQVI